MRHIPVLFAFLLLALPAMAADLNQSSWSENDANNNSPPPAGWPAGMAPNQVEPTARAMMGATKRWYDHANATATSGGSGNAQTLTYTVAPTALVQGDVYRFTAGVTNTGATTININSLGPKAIQVNGAALAGGELFAGKIVEIIYDGTQFQLNPTSIGGLALPMMATTAAVKALGAGQFPAIFRLNNVGSDGATQIYLWSGTACSLTGGDDISQIAPSVGTGCWVLPASEAWYPLISQNAGCELDGATTHAFLRTDCNATVKADHFQVKMANPGLAHIAISGTPTAGERPGITLTVAGTAYTVKYTVQGSDTTNTLIGIGLQNCLQNDTGIPLSLGMSGTIAAHPNCTASPSSLTNAMLALSPKQWTAAGNATLYNGGLDFDIPLPLATNLAGVSSAHTTVVTSPNGSTAGAQTDNGPYMSMVSYNPGRVPLAGDHLGMYRIEGQDSTGAIAAQYAGIFGNIVDPIASAPLGEGCLGSANGSGNPALLPTLCWSKGIYTDDGNGAGTKLPDLGHGAINGALLQAQNASTDATSIRIKNTSVGGTEWTMQSIGSGVAGRVGNLEILNIAMPNAAIAIQPNGNVGIGKLVPTHALDIKGPVALTRQITISADSAPPSIGSGFGGAGKALAGSDAVGRITVGAGGASSGAILFATAFPNSPPACMTQDETTGNLMRPTPTASQLTITGTMLASDKIVWHCIAYD